jgi:hypothetical protein
MRYLTRRSRKRSQTIQRRPERRIRVLPQNQCLACAPLTLRNRPRSRRELGAKDQGAPECGGLCLFARRPLTQGWKRIENSVKLPNCHRGITDRRAQPYFLDCEVERYLTR